MLYLRVRTQEGDGHTFCMSMYALGAGKVMMMHCLHFDRTMLLCRRVGVPPEVSSLADELLYWSVDHYNNVQMLVERKGGCHVARWQESVNIT